MGSIGPHHGSNGSGSIAILSLPCGRSRLRIRLLSKRLNLSFSPIGWLRVVNLTAHSPRPIGR